MNTKWCTRCEDHLPISDFGFNHRNGARRSWCRSCVAESHRFRRSGATPLTPTDVDRAYAPWCTCDVAEPARGQWGACECGFPIVALMAASCQSRMDVLWPEWREQVVFDPDMVSA